MTGIAVVIPCHDLGRTLAEAVDSVLLQTRAADEIVVVDDGSTDPETIQVLKLLQRPRTRVVSIPHAGVAAARNHGVSLTRAPALVLLDADDVLDTRYLEKLGARLDAGLDYVSCAVRAFEGASYVWKPPPLTPLDCLTRGSVHVSTMMRRALFDAVGGFDTELLAYEDLDFWLHALRRGFRGEVLDEPLLHYRVRADSRYRQGIEQETYVRTMQRILERHRDVVEAGGLEVLAKKEEFLLELRQHQLNLLRARDQRPPTGQRAGVVLAWHRIAELDPDTHQLCVSPDRFRDQVKLLRDRCTVMPLLDLLQAAQADALPPNAVALTFDDGYLDALTTAAPILDGLPATFFVNTERLAEPHEAWHDELERLFPERTAQLAAHAQVMSLGYHERSILLDQMWAASGLDRAPREERRLLLTDEVVRLSRMPGCEIGSHTANHLQLPVHPPQVQRNELRWAKEELEALLDRPVLTFAYPFGEYGADAVDAVREAGHLVAVTVEPGLVTAGTDALLLPRIEVSDCDAEELWTALREVRLPEPLRVTRERMFADNSERSRNELAAGATRLSTRPTFLIIDPTSRCNARCVMCPVSFRAPNDKGQDLPPDVFGKLASLIPTAAHLNLFSSGEPTIAKGIARTVREARRLAPSDTPIWISSNGKRLPLDLLETLIAPNVAVQFSVDGGTQEVFESVRRGIRFSELRASLGAVQRRRGSLPYPRLSFSTTLSKRNLHDLAAIFALAKEFGVAHISFYEEDPEVPEEEPFALDESDRPVFEAQLPQIEASGVEYSNGLVFRGVHGLRAREVAPPADPPPLRCSAPWKVFHARADGTVRTCCTLRTSMGDLSQQTVEEIWNGPQYIGLRRAFVEQRGIPGTCYRCTDPLRTLA